MVTEKLLNKLKESQADFALDALKRPQERDVFEYGYRVGMVAGFEEAINVLLTLLDEEKYSDKGL
jgi:hypothetical protein|tara:strand:- start:274 stop:468 length:195 start_codon:yes stop_codon:yes gene_type:complete